MINESLPDYESFKRISERKAERKLISKAIKTSSKYLDKFHQKFYTKEDSRPYHITRRYNELCKIHTQRKFSGLIVFDRFRGLTRRYHCCSCCNDIEYHKDKPLKETQRAQIIAESEAKFYDNLQEECFEEFGYNEFYHVDCSCLNESYSETTGDNMNNSDPVLVQFKLYKKNTKKKKLNYNKKYLNFENCDNKSCEFLDDYILVHDENSSVGEDYVIIENDVN